MVGKKKNAILLVDNDPVRRNNTSSRLRVQNIETELATGGFHAVHLVENNKYDLVIIIEDMEDMSAFEVMGLIRTQFPGNKLPILYSSRSTAEQTILAGVEAGASDYLVLSDNFNELLKKIEKLTYVPEPVKKKDKKKPGAKKSA